VVSGAWLKLDAISRPVIQGEFLLVRFPLSSSPHRLDTTLGMV